MEINKKITVDLDHDDIQKAIAKAVEDQLQDEGVEVSISTRDVTLTAAGSTAVVISARVVVDS